MISFKTYLTEARMAPLYHATPIGNVELILKNGFKPHTYQTIYRGKGQASLGRYGVSFTRNMKNADWYMKNQYQDEHYVVFEVDQQKIHQRYKIVPVDYFGTTDALSTEYPTGNRDSYRKEAEEFVIVKKTWDNAKDDFVGALPANVISKIHYFKYTHKPSDWDKYYNDRVDFLKDKWRGYKWVERKPL